MKHINLIEEFRESGYTIAFMSTYSIDLPFFEQMILRHLLEHECTYIGLFADGACLTESLRQKRSVLELGKSYVVQPVYGPGAFHPKLFLFLGPDKAKLFIGSGNLTPAGFITNREVFRGFSYEKGKEEHLSLIQSAYQLFQAYHRKQPVKWMKRLFRQAEDCGYLFQPAPPHAQIRLFHNTAESLQDQLAAWIPGQMERLEIMAPYFDRSLSVLSTWEAHFQPKKISFYLQNETGNFPLDHAASSQHGIYEVKFNDQGDKTRRYNGKVYRMHQPRAEVLIYGSANFSRQAWLETADSGNTEAIIAARGERGSFDPFFEGEMEILPGDQLRMSEEEDETSSATTAPVQFVEGIKTREELIVRLSATEDIQRVLLEQIPGNMMTSGSQAEIRWEVELAPSSPVLVLQIEMASGTVELTGWVHEEERLEQTHAMAHPSVYPKLQQDPELQDYQNILRLLEDFLERLALTEEDLQSKRITRKRSASIHEQAELSEETAGVNSNRDDYYIADEEEQKAYGSMGGVDVLGELIRQLLKPFHTEAEQWKAGVVHAGSSTGASKPQAELTPQLHKHLQLQLGRFMKKFQQGIQAPAYMEKVSQEILFTNVSLYTQFLWKLHHIHTEESFISDDELLQELYGVLMSICDYAKEHVIEHPYFKEVLLPQLLALLIAHDAMLDKEENYVKSMGERKRISEALRDLHFHICPIRTDYLQYASQMLVYLNRLGLNLTEQDVQTRFEHRFPFVTLEQFLKELQIFPVKTWPKRDKPLLVLWIDDFKLSTQFNYVQLKILERMVSVEEWMDQPMFKIVWVHRNEQHNLKKYSLFYHKEKSYLRKKFEYRTGLKDRTSTRRHVRVSHLQEAVEARNTQYLVDGFKDDE